MKGIFISFEGIEGSGKSTQVSLLAGFLSDKGYTVTRTAEPGGTVISTRIRELLLSNESSGMDPVTELLLYNAARVQHIKEIISPALERGELVITDRFSDSTMAYQGYGRGIDLRVIDALDRIATSGLRPDITLLLDMEVEEGLARNRKINKSDRLELEDISFHEKVRKGFIAIASKEVSRVRLVECSGNIEAVQAQVRDIVTSYLDYRAV